MLIENVFDAVTNNPQEALNLKLRAQIMRSIRQHIKANEWTQAKAAEVLRVTQPRISDLQRGKITLFSLDTLVGMSGLLGNDIELVFKTS